MVSEPNQTTSPEERDEMLADLYGELRRAAARLLARESPTLTLQPTNWSMKRRSG